MFLSVPTQPIEVSFYNVTNSSVLVKWSPPQHPNGIIQGYRLYYMHKNFTDVSTMRVKKSVLDQMSKTGITATPSSSSQDSLEFMLTELGN